MFQVLDGGKPTEMKDTVLWADSIFQHFDQAYSYAKRWVEPGFENNVPNEPDKKVDWSGHGHMIEIKSL